MSQRKQNEAARKQRLKEAERDPIHGFDDLDQCKFDEEVIFVNDKASCDEAAIILNAETECIGLGMKCLVKQFSTWAKRKTCQILQVATTQKVILFDLEAVPASKEFDALLHGIFDNPEILKIGMSFLGDIKLLREAYPLLTCFKCIIKNYFELDAVLSFIRSKRGKQVFNVDDKTEYKIKQKVRQRKIQPEGGLATIARFVTKKRLPQKEQLSNWAQRPLRAVQVKSAALDAKIQIDIFQALAKHSKLLSENNWIADLSCS